MIVIYILINEFSLFISEFTKETYRSEFGLINLTYFSQKSRGSTNDFGKNLILFKNILLKLKILHDEGIIMLLRNNTYEFEYE